MKTYKHLSLEERERIFAFKQSGVTISEILIAVIAGSDPVQKLLYPSLWTKIKSMAKMLIESEKQGERFTISLQNFIRTDMQIAADLSARRGTDAEQLNDQVLFQLALRSISRNLGHAADSGVDLRDELIAQAKEVLEKFSVKTT